MDNKPALPEGQDRGLTPGEIEMARGIYGDSIDYSQVRIHNGKPAVQSAIGKFMGQKNLEARAAADGNDIYFPTSQYSSDFSKAGPVDKHTFIHEMAHTWQRQNNSLLSRLEARIEMIVTAPFNYDSLYAFKPDPAKKLGHYNMEQQAEMIADYFDYKQRQAGLLPKAETHTPQSMEQNLNYWVILDGITQQYAKNPSEKWVADQLKSGRIEMDEFGRAHFTQKAADEMNEKNGNKAQGKYDADLLAVLREFIQNPSYLKEDPSPQAKGGNVRNPVSPKSPR